MATAELMPDDEGQSKMKTSLELEHSWIKELVLESGSDVELLDEQITVMDGNPVGIIYYIQRECCEPYGITKPRRILIEITEVTELGSVVANHPGLTNTEQEQVTVSTSDDVRHVVDADRATD